MKHLSIRLGFCLAVAVIAAALADPLVEFASNAGWFGAGAFTDHSNLDVAPALVIGLLLLGLHVALKVRAALQSPGHHQDLSREAGQALASGIARLLPAIFMLQIIALYLMETAEQFAVWGHTLGPTVWLGGPVLVSLGVHGLTCAAVAFVIANRVRALAATTVRLIRLIRALATFAFGADQLVVPQGPLGVTLRKPAPVLCRIGERAPPLASV